MSKEKGSLQSDSSSLASPSLPRTIQSKVGKQAVLPCSWKSRLDTGAGSACHILWSAPPNVVFERLREEKWEATDLKGRAEVPEEKLESGDCSLIINNVQIVDTGIYESFMVVDGVRSKKTRVFLQSVKLSVTDHQSRYSRYPGEDLFLELHTTLSYRLVFQGRNSSEWSVVWMREGGNSQRFEKHPVLEQITIKNLTHSDDGTYKVLDEHGLSVSTVQLSVEEQSTAFRVQQELENAITDAAARSSCSDLLILSVLVSWLQILHLL
ncbi:galectin 17 [Cololabis saira]|uniref:galectin 17 n=1 Tax=Cololabis saira TaxID=129043 RepID=UPI002AD24521|nr:galectin 17 [Cololabis saira]